ncbi:MAG: tRNA (guanine(10)-N(2))-dimethyltransferase, partial [Methanomicrobiales archaeon HGW-Methanomicrobiales-5]
LKISPPDINIVLDRIRAEGYAASRTHFCGYGIKTEAPLAIIKAAIHPDITKNG